LISDVIYFSMETPLLARLRGNPNVNGLDLMLNQACAAFNAWFGVMPEITPVMRRLHDSRMMRTRLIPL